DEHFNLIGQAKKILDLGAAPGGWLQIAKARAHNPKIIIGLDLLPIEPIDKITLIQADFFDLEIDQHIKKTGYEKFDLILCDMASNATGHAKTDHLRAEMLSEAVFDFSLERLEPNAHLVMKVFAGGIGRELLVQMRGVFDKVRHYKPPSSRKRSAEIYLIASHFFKTL
ncbi:MAG: RlmE family RNA methyltransferase, partial [Pseudomonadota bacterium]